MSSPTATSVTMAPTITSPSLLMNGKIKQETDDGGIAPKTISTISLTGPGANGISSETPVSISGSSATRVVAANSSSSSGSVKRIDVDALMVEFQKLLGDNWDRYRDTITHFLVGKLTRFELQEELDQILDKTTIQLHNQFLLANMANSLRDPPPGDHGMLTGWSKKHKDSSRNVKGDSQLAKLKEDIMGLSVRERKRIKAIARESGKRAPIPSTVTATRQAMLPKIPFVNDKEKLQSSGNQKQTSGRSSRAPTPTPVSTPAQPTGTGAGHTNPIVWTQDIIHAYETPLACETYELPDSDSLTARMLGISLEHGLLKGVDQGTPAVMMAGLEHYLRDLIRHVFEKVKGGNPQGEDALTAENMALLLESAPHMFVEMSAPVYKLKNVMLRDDNYDEDDDVMMGDADEDPSELNKLLKEILSG
jgi:transcriptional coactivator HFI1/ADA1